MTAAGAANHRVFRDGDLSGTLNDPATGPPVNMSDAGNEHGTSVMTCMTGDGTGDEIGGAARAVQHVVLGTGKDVKFRPIKPASDFLTSIRARELVATDADVKVVSSSLVFVDTTGTLPAQPAAHGHQTHDRQRQAVFRRGRQRGPVAFPSQRDVLRTEGGFLAPRRSR